MALRVPFGHGPGARITLIQPVIGPNPVLPGAAYGNPGPQDGYFDPRQNTAVVPHFSIIVPPGRLWVMGDNRAISDDSRGHMTSAPDDGTVPESEVVGRAFLIMWPFSQFGDLPIPGPFAPAGLGAAR